MIFLTTHVMAFLCPTKSILAFQPSLSMILATGKQLFKAWDETRYCPSGDQLRRKIWVVPPQSSKGSDTVASSFQSDILQIFNVLSSLCLLTEKRDIVPVNSGSND